MQDRWNSLHYKQYLQAPEWKDFDLLGGLSIQGNEKIVDLCCGDGRLVAMLAQKIPQGKIIGIDISPSMIQHCQKEYHAIKNAEFILGDIENFLFAEQFEYIISFRSLHWIKEQQPLYHKLASLLKPEGKLMIQMAAKLPPLLATAIEALQSQPQWKPFFQNKSSRFFPQTESNMHLYLKNAGFRSIQTNMSIYTYRIPDSVMLINLLLCFIPHLLDLPEKEARYFAEEVAQFFYQSEEKNPNEEISIEFTQLNIRAEDHTHSSTKEIPLDACKRTL